MWGLLDIHMIGKGGSKWVAAGFIIIVVLKALQWMGY